MSNYPMRFFQRLISLPYTLLVPSFVIIGLGGFLWFSDKHLGEAFWSILLLMGALEALIIVLSPDVFARVTIDENGMRSKLFGITLWSIEKPEDILDIRKQFNYMRIMSYKLIIPPIKRNNPNDKGERPRTVFIEVSERSTHYLERFIGMKRFRHMLFKNTSAF